MVTEQCETRKVDEIRAHEMNLHVFGEFMHVPEQHDEDMEFEASIKEHGILQPLIITQNNKLISGHRRLAAARRLGMQTVPVRVEPVEDEFDLDVKWCEYNRYRTMTPEQRMKFYEARLRLEKVRRAAQQYQNDPEAQAELHSRGRHRRPEEIAAEAVGCSRETMRKAKKVKQAIEAARERGDNAIADDLLNTLNTKSINAAAAKVQLTKRRRTPERKTDSGPEAYFDASEQRAWKAAYGTLVRMQAKLAKFCAANPPAGMSVEGAKAICDRLSACLDDFLADWKSLNPNVRWT